PRTTHATAGDTDGAGSRGAHGSAAGGRTARHVLATTRNENQAQRGNRHTKGIVADDHTEFLRIVGAASPDEASTLKHRISRRTSSDPWSMLRKSYLIPSGADAIPE